uniref:Partial AB-hydrolase lipase domain-containing protein n=1 Tax=Timema genevievae TaxID=629358 RepID=A0A7R9K4D1_TIMGE|nr:unnamed protein product [Timema genevievae]
MMWQYFTIEGVRVIHVEDDAATLICTAAIDAVRMMIDQLQWNPQPVNMGSNILIVALTLCSVTSSWGWREGSVVSEELFAAANPDTYLTAPELIAKKGYPAETHTVTTEDGYILTLHRIPYGKSAFILADAGYDVWLGNTRGNTYSKKHVSLKSTDKAYWAFR